MGGLWGVYENDGKALIASGGMAVNAIFGIRPVVTLKKETKFVPAENNINDTKTWDLNLE